MRNQQIASYPISELVLGSLSSLPHFSLGMTISNIFAIAEVNEAGHPWFGIEGLGMGMTMMFPMSEK